jgi:hypothetical protein
MNFSIAVKLIKSLIAYVDGKRDCSEEYESRTMENLMLITTKILINLLDIRAAL